ncbi:enolase C-terminal domain-like protein [Yoonia sediminilitoris]|uniref:L-rhamnonate dehydratase n=1 Tax=Yoonia sediminilitoris TaxID=1286148 RepID=A0A2T6K4M2_9RHOB|nr:enolase C-terminal domain-like protein [Yoonia sediminilitoris]PUB09546.1 L-rhamnonate dehydratase [Yoonia sediminilitoris]RCW89501.1 L-rhamnonate dehydratase [Yoonia sediminilitoris]
MKIASIQARAIDCGFQTQKLQTSRVASPMSRWPQFGENRSSWMWPSKKVFVRIESDDGLVGWSCTNGGEVVALIVQAHLSRLIEGTAVTDIADVWDQMFNSLLPSGHSGFSMMAVAAVDIALWDLQCKTRGVSLVAALGGGASDLPVYCTTQQPKPFSGGGWWGLKAATPYGPGAGEQGLRANVDYVGSFRDASGPDGRIMLDSFMAWDADYTLRFAQEAAQHDLYWIEDPLPPYDMEGLHKLKSGLGGSTRLALGNFSFNRWDCAALIREGLADVLQPDVAWAGGITECLRILDMAKAAEVPVILHNTCEQPWALALAAAKQSDPVVEFVDRGKGSSLYGLMGDAPVFKNGRVVVPTDTTGNQPPEAILNQFADHDATKLLKEV